ncbi:MAG: hypothetical protein ACXV7G_10670 [Halobacteriota archaeon]
MRQQYSRAMQTVFHGIRYKSRAEARWAVFFWTLGIPYEYEPEGFVLGEEKFTYLPDFYLPEQDCFIEVKPIGKGKTSTLDYPRPNDEDVLKAGLLNECWGKDVFLFYERPDPEAAEGVMQSRGAIAWTDRTRKQDMAKKRIPYSYVEEYKRGQREFLPFDYGYYWTQCPNRFCKTSEYGVTKDGRADFLPCNCYVDHYRKILELCSDGLSADEMKLMWHWMTDRYATPLLRKAYANAAGAWFDGGKAWEGHPRFKVPITANISYPFTPEKWKLLVEMHDLINANAQPNDPERLDHFHTELTQSMQKINWEYVRGVKEVLRYSVAL